MAVDVGVDLLHVLEVVFRVVGLVLLEYLDYLAPRLVALGLALPLPNRLGLLGL